MEPSQFMKKEWMKAIPEAEIRVYEKMGLGTPLKFGDNPALVVIDVTLAFTGSKPQSLEEAIDEFPSACGDAAWKALPQIKRLLQLFRDKSYPVIYTRSDHYDQKFTGTATKSTRPINTNPKWSEFPEIIAPLESEWILDKTKSSIFFNSSLNSYLVKQKVDTLVLCGVSTSGCVRASVIDSFSYGYTTIVVEDCCFDRSYSAHCANLFDMEAKYSSVLDLEEVQANLNS